MRVEDLPGGRTATARVASNLRFSEESQYWLVGIGLDLTGNHWFIAPMPPDWELHTSATKSASSDCPDPVTSAG